MSSTDKSTPLLDAIKAYAHRHAGDEEARSVRFSSVTAYTVMRDIFNTGAASGFSYDFREELFRDGGRRLEEAGMFGLRVAVDPSLAEDELVFM